MSKGIARFAQNGDMNVRGEIVQTPEELWGTGGRNLLKNSQEIRVTGSDTSAVVKRSFSGGISTLEVYADGNRWNWYGWIHSNLTDPVFFESPGESRTLSLDVRASVSGSVGFSFDTRTPDRSIHSPKIIIEDTGGEWVRVSTTMIMPERSPQSASLLLLTSEGNISVGDKVEVKNIKLEKGEVSGEWTAAPEDLGITWLPDWIQNFDAPIVYSENGDLAINGEFVELPMELRGTGGRNLLSGGHEEVGKDITESQAEHVYYADIYDILDDCLEEEITISFDIKAEVGQYLQVYCSNRSDDRTFNSHIFRNFGTEKQRLSFVTRAVMGGRGVGNKSSWLEFYGIYNTGNTFRISNVKIEKGNRHTGWSPAPEDLGVEWLPESVQNFDLPLTVQNAKLSLPQELRGSGGRNLVLNSKELRAYTSNNLVTAEVVDDGPFKNVLKLTTSSSDFSYFTTMYRDMAEQPPIGSKIVLSLLARGVLRSGLENHLSVYYNSGTSQQAVKDGIKPDEYQTIQFVFDVQSEAARFHIYPRNFEELYIQSAKIEYGEVGTPWSPAPEDLGLTIPLSVQHFERSVIDLPGKYEIAIAGEVSEVADAIKMLGSSSSYIQSPNPLSHQQPTEQEWTVEAMVRVKVTDATGYQYLLTGMNHGIQITRGTNGRPLMYLNGGVNDSYVYGRKDLRDGEWHHLAFVYRYSDLTKMYYLDGVVDNGSTASRGEQIPSGMSDTLRFGESLDGEIQYVRIWDRALTQEEVRSVMYKKRINDERIVGLWIFDESPDGQIKNLASGDSGEVQGMVEWTYTLDEEGAS